MAILSQHALLICVVLLSSGEAAPRFMFRRENFESPRKLLSMRSDEAGKDTRGKCKKSKDAGWPCCTHDGDASSCWGSGCFYRNKRKGGNCLKSIPRVAVGGAFSSTNYSDASNDGKLNRPEFMVLSRRNSTTKVWEACSSNDCFHPFSADSGKGKGIVVANLSDSGYDKVAMEVLIKCEGTGNTIELKMFCASNSNRRRISGPSNANLTVWYNLQPVDVQFNDSETEAGCVDSGGGAKFQAVLNGGGNWMDHRDIPIDASDEYPVLRIEMDKKNASDSAVANVELQVYLKNVGLGFDECMEKKQQHAVCLQNLSIGADIRSNHNLQKQCLDGTDTSVEGCTAWKTCLSGTNSDSMLLKILNAADIVNGSAGSLLDSSEHHGTRPAVGTTACDPAAADTDHGACVDPHTFDIEAFDCSCFDAIQNLTEHGLWEWICDHPKACCVWKEAHCNESHWAQSSLLEQRSNDDTSKAASRRSNDDTRSSLDDSLTEKCR